jgi:hypothetical protein
MIELNFQFNIQYLPHLTFFNFQFTFIKSYLLRAFQQYQKSVHIPQ